MRRLPIEVGERLLMVVMTVFILALPELGSPSGVRGKALEVVSIQTDKETYRAGEEVVVTIQNRLDFPITTYDQQAFCSIVRLERREDERWKEVRNCFSGMPRRPVTLEPHTKAIIRLPIRPGSQPDGLAPGMYRASLLFQIGETFRAARQPLVVHSKPFRIC